MRFQSQAKVGSKSPVVAFVALAEWKRGRWLSVLEAKLRERVQAAAERLREPLSHGSTLHVSGVERSDEDLWVWILPEREELFYFLGQAREACKAAVAPRTKSVQVVFAQGEHAEELADAFGSALAARIFLMPVFGKRREKQKAFQLTTVLVGAPHGLGAAKRLESSLEKGFVLGEGTNLARELAMLPPNVLDPARYGERIRKVAREHGLKARFYSNKELKRMGAGAFTAVDQGNPESAGGIYEITYTPSRGRGGKPIALVGKGLCFDTGGYDIKINSAMMTMKGDMQGSAVALAGVMTAAMLKLPYPVKAFLGVTENHLSPVAYKADEIVTALNGLSIEVVNTDAEGRMVLADTLALASRESPRCVIDFATLTGAAVRSIGTKYSVGFTNQRKLHSAIVEAGERSGERVWTFPLDSTYYPALESKIADTLQCTRGGPDHIHAACFLSKFVKDGVPWVHLDLSASENDGGLAHVDSLFTGFGVRWLHAFLARF